MDAVPDPDGAHALLAGRYAVGPLVGMGGTAQVYRAWDHERGCPVALKVFRPGSMPGPGYGGARELEVLTGVRHPGLVGVRGAGIDPQGCPFVVMDLVDGQSLSARLYDGPMGAADVARLGGVLADALAAVHARGVVHRDVKPGNVLLDADGHPWLTDFGIARIVDATRVTATGVVVGTAAYMAPEQVRGEAVGPPADVYALGLVLLEAVTGHREYDGAAVESALARLHRAPRVPETLPDPLAATLRRMTAARPEVRPTAAEVAAALPAAAEAAAALRGRVPGEPVDRPRPARTLAATVGRRAAPVAALACLVTGALVGALSLAGPERPAEDPRTVLVPAAAPPALLAVPPVVADVDGVAPTPDPQPVPVALAAPTRTAPRTGARTAATVDGSRDDSDEHGADASDRASRDAQRGGDAPGPRADRDGDDDKDKDRKKDEADDGDRDEHADDGDRGGKTHDGGHDGGHGGHGGKGGHSGSDDG
jgi:aminoglycoside phosphotransferase (APT) family kinase protein